MESLLHNMSAPPRSKIILAPNIQETTFLSFSLDDLPDENADFAQNFLQFCKHPSYESLTQKLTEVEKTLQLAPILTLASPPSKSIPIEGLFSAVALLVKSTGSLYMQRRKPIFSYTRLSKSIYIPHHHFLHLMKKGGRLCLP